MYNKHCRTIINVFPDIILESAAICEVRADEESGANS